MKCQKCDSPELYDSKRTIPVKFPRGSLTILDVPIVKCAKCGHEVMLMSTSGRIEDLVERWKEIGMPGDQTIRFK